MDKIVKLRVQGLTNSQLHSGAYALILSEEGPRRIPIIVGISEAQSIAIALEELKPPRPLTHDLFVAFIQASRIRLKEVFINKFVDGVFFSEMVFDDGFHEIRIDSRTSDAIAMALRMKCNIYTLESIIQRCGIVLEDMEFAESDEDTLLKTLNPEDIKDRETLKVWFSLLPDDEIDERMEKAIAEEKYEYANMYKEELNRRQKMEEKS
ncbi:MAG: bifunctional nuclease family protein [Tannerella sp.]|nr:bifunctional nuclease family protein [Tannerella sp.]